MSSPPELVAYKLNFVSKQTGIYLTQKLQEMCIWAIYVNLNGKNEFNIQKIILKLLRFT